jgi:hypothetical protein
MSERALFATCSIAFLCLFVWIIGRMTNTLEYGLSTVLVLIAFLVSGAIIYWILDKRLF